MSVHTTCLYSGKLVYHYAIAQFNDEQKHAFNLFSVCRYPDSYVSVVHIRCRYLSVVPHNYIHIVHVKNDCFPCRYMVNREKW